MATDLTRLGYLESLKRTASHKQKSIMPKLIGTGIIIGGGYFALKALGLVWGITTTLVPIAGVVGLLYGGWKWIKK